MNAIVCAKYGSPDVLQLQQVERPTPRDNEVLIRVHATSVNFGDMMARNFKAITPRRFNMPLALLASGENIPGHQGSEDAHPGE